MPQLYRSSCACMTDVTHSTVLLLHASCTWVNNTQVIVELVCICTTYIFQFLQRCTRLQSTEPLSLRVNIRRGSQLKTSVDFSYIGHSWGGQYSLLYPYYHKVTLTATDPFCYTSRIKLSHACRAIHVQPCGCRKVQSSQFTGSNTEASHQQ